MLAWVSSAVGVIGTERNEANLMYGGVLRHAVAGSSLAVPESGAGATTRGRR